MNKFIITAQILSEIKVTNKNLKKKFFILIATPNNKKNVFFFQIQVSLKDILLKQIDAFYKKKDFCIIEGNIKIRYDPIEQNNLFKKYKFKKKIFINLETIQPYLII